MSGICGVIQNDRSFKLHAQQLFRMTYALDVDKSIQATSYVECHGAVGMGTRSFPGRIAGAVTTVVNGHSCCLAFHGNLFQLGQLFPERPHGDPIAGLLERLIDEGIGLVGRLRGEFALAFWDARSATLHLATDPFRVHPIYYTHDRDGMVFASRMNAVLASPVSLRPSLDNRAIVDLVVMSSIPTPRTIYREIKKLPPGHILTYSSGQQTLSQYWDISFSEASNIPEGILGERLKREFSEAVSVRLAYDKAFDHVGSFLSGGIDSSTVTGVMGQSMGRPVNSFTIGFHEDKYNEISYARIAAHAFQSKHHEYFVQPEDVFKAIPILLTSFDEPFANSSAVPTYFCTKMAREHGVTVLYAGDGGDELFAGNERYAFQRLFDYYHKLPLMARRFAIDPLSAFGASVGIPFFAKAMKYIEKAKMPYVKRMNAYNVFSVVPMSELFEKAFLEDVGLSYNPYAISDSYFGQAKATTDLHRHLYLDLKLAISDNDLFKVTRMAEANGVAVRYPFLDRKLAEFASVVPAHVKMRGRKLRSFFKETYADFLPPAIIKKTKHGFGLPIPVWLRTDKPLNEMMLDLVLSRRSVQRGYFHKGTLEQIVKNHKTDETPFYGSTLWHLMALELWLREHEQRTPT